MNESTTSDVEKTSAVFADPAEFNPAVRTNGVRASGAKETRTPDPLHAMQVLYQLSYGPMNAVEALGSSVVV